MKIKYKIVIERSPPKISEAFKRQVVSEYERGGITKDAIAAKYGIKGHSTVLRWCRKYGKFDYSSLETKRLGRPLMDPLQRRIKELEAAVAERDRSLQTAQQKIYALETLVKEIEKVSKGIVKKLDTKQ